MSNWIDDTRAHFLDLFNLVHPYELDCDKGRKGIAAALIDQALSDAVGTCEKFGEMTRLNTRLTHEDHTCP